MAKIDGVEIRNGSVVFTRAVEEVPSSTKREGNVTINNVGSPGVPAYFEVSFMLNSNFSDGAIKSSNVFHWHCIVPAENSDQSYQKIEDDAARQIAPMLRELADLVEGQVGTPKPPADPEAHEG